MKGSLSDSRKTGKRWSSNFQNHVPSRTGTEMNFSQAIPLTQLRTKFCSINRVTALVLTGTQCWIWQKLALKFTLMSLLICVCGLFIKYLFCSPCGRLENLFILFLTNVPLLWFWLVIYFALCHIDLVMEQK